MKDRLYTLWKNLRQEKWLLLFCLALAFLAWQGIRRNIGFEVSISNIAVDVNVPPGWAVWEKSAHRVNILFRGSREQIRYLNNDQLRVVVTVASPRQGQEMVFPLSPKDLRNPTGAKVVRFNPSEIVVRLDREGEKQLPVKAALAGSPPEGIEIDRIVCTPAAVRVSGARQVLDAMENIHTEPIDLKNRQASFKESVPVALPQAGRIQVQPEWVSVEVFLEARGSTQAFEQVPVRILGPPGDRRSIDLQPKTINITVKGQQQRLEEIKAADLMAYVNCMELVASTGYDLPVSVSLPTGLKLVKTDPAIVHVVVGRGN